MTSNNPNESPETQQSEPISSMSFVPNQILQGLSVISLRDDAADARPFENGQPMTEDLHSRDPLSPLAPLYETPNEPLGPPILRIPTEITQVIFLLAAGGYVETSGVGEIWTISHVCRVWRDIALATPELWSSIGIMEPPVERARIPSTMGTHRGHITVDPLEPSSPAIIIHHGRRLAECLDRSQNAPLSVSITASSRPFFAPLFNLLVSLCQRWRSLRLNIHDSLMMYLLLVQAPLPLLCRLAISLQRPDIDFPTLPPPAAVGSSFNAFVEAPLLKEVTLDGGQSYGHRLHRIHFTDLRITTFATTMLAAPSDIDSLRRMSNLRELVLIAPPRPRFRFPVLHLNELRTLVIGNKMSCVKDLVLPALESIFFHSISHGHLGDIVSLIERSNAQLRRLHLHGTFCLKELIPLLELIGPTLVQLDLQFMANWGHDCTPCKVGKSQKLVEMCDLVGGRTRRISSVAADGTATAETVPYLLPALQSIQIATRPLRSDDLLRKAFKRVRVRRSLEGPPMASILADFAHMCNVSLFFESPVSNTHSCSPHSGIR